MSVWNTMRFGDSRPVIIGHRGLPELALENTGRSFELAMATGCDSVEVDVHVTADKRVICLHDHDLLRIAGNDAKASSLTLDEMRALFPAVLEYETFLAMTGDMPIMVDTKECSAEDFAVIADVTDKAGTTDRIIFSVMTFDFARMVRERWPNAAIAAHAHKGLDHLQMAEEVDASFIRLFPEDWTSAEIERLHAKGYATLAVASPLSSTRTSTNRDALKALADLGIRAIIADRCDWAMEVLPKRS